MFINVSYLPPAGKTILYYFLLIQDTNSTQSGTHTLQCINTRYQLYCGLTRCYTLTQDTNTSHRPKKLVREILYTWDIQDPQAVIQDTNSTHKSKKTCEGDVVYNEHTRSQLHRPTHIWSLT